MASAETRFQGSKEEGGKDVGTLSVVIFFQEACQGLEEQREAGHLYKQVKLREKSQLRLEMLE